MISIFSNMTHESVTICSSVNAVLRSYRRFVACEPSDSQCAVKNTTLEIHPISHCITSIVNDYSSDPKAVIFAFYGYLRHICNDVIFVLLFIHYNKPILLHY